MTLSAAVYDSVVSVPPWRQGQGTRRIAVHAPDEDTLTLAWQAGRALLDRHPGVRPAALLLATTTPPVTDGGNASLLAEALRLDPDGLLVQEHAGGLFASGSALASAAALVTAGVAPALVLLADTRHSDRGRALGSGAAALLVDAEGPVGLRITATDADSSREVYALGDGVVDAEPAFTRWLAASAQDPPGTVAVRPGSQGLPGIGHLGCAAPWAQAAALLEQPADTSPGERRTLRLEIGGGARYRVDLDIASGWRPAAALGAQETNAVPPPSAPAAEGFSPYTSQVQAWRDRREELRLTGMRCSACAAPQYPAAPACPQHGPAAELSPHDMALTGSVLTRTRDHVFPVGGPLTAAVVELADGGRFYGQVAAGYDVAIGDPVVLVLRRIATAADAAPRYFWKILPTPAEDRTEGTGR
ncbi:zinc ribbon domain-containing protein (plasmid) [Streptomyces sp. GDS52]|uniref:zinc ribbon domain-containing protein n=1 Tax=Streptomyces sp. GDS52 TaxID=3406419 RepID=UPI003FD0B411